ncbi:MAG: serine protease [Flavobacteriales bacterium]|nr:serine protease [Flavobacteriales bacterium]
MNLHTLTSTFLIFILGHSVFAQHDTIAESNSQPKDQLFQTKRVSNLEDAIKASVTILVEDGHGSGFFIDDNLVVTNYHVVEEADSVEAKSSSGKKFSLSVALRDSVLDLAILRPSFSSEVYFSMSDSPELDAVEVGTDVMVIGSPTSRLLSNSLGSGIISGVRELDSLTIIQTDAKVNPGNSGGPLVDRNGRVLGVVSSKIDGFGIEGLGFAIPTKYITELLDRLSSE